MKNWTRQRLSCEQRETGSATSGELKSSLSRTQQQLAENEKEVERLRKEKTGLEKSLSAAQVEMKGLQEISNKAKKALEVQIAEKQTTINDLLKQLKDTTGSSAAEASKLHDELASMRLQLQKQEMTRNKPKDSYWTPMHKQ